MSRNFYISFFTLDTINKLNSKGKKGRSSLSLQLAIKTSPAFPLPEHRQGISPWPLGEIFMTGVCIPAPLVALHQTHFDLTIRTHSHFEHLHPCHAQMSSSHANRLCLQDYAKHPQGSYRSFQDLGEVTARKAQEGTTTSFIVLLCAPTWGKGWMPVHRPRSELDTTCTKEICGSCQQKSDGTFHN